MLPDFPKIKAELNKSLNKYSQFLHSKHPLLSQIRKERHYEGKEMSIDRENGVREISKYKEISSTLADKKEELIEKGFIAIIENIPNVIEDINKQISRLLFDRVEDAAKKSGNIIECKSRKFDFDVFMDMLEKVSIEFTDQGVPMLPTISFSDPEYIKTKFIEWGSNKEYKERFQKLMEKKKKEWDAEESNRKLVD